MCRFWAYDESKKLLGAGKDAPAWKLAAAGSMGARFLVFFFFQCSLSQKPLTHAAGGIAGFIGNPGGASIYSSYRSCDKSQVPGLQRL